MEQKIEDASQEGTSTNPVKDDEIAEKKSDDSAESGKTPDITESQATIKIEGQEFELEASLAHDDNLLKTILQPHFASIENSSITRDVKDGRLQVTIVKKAQHKGGGRRNER